MEVGVRGKKALQERGKNLDMMVSINPVLRRGGKKRGRIEGRERGEETN